MSHRVQRNSAEEAPDRERPALRRVTRALTQKRGVTRSPSEPLSSRFPARRVPWRSTTSREGEHQPAHLPRPRGPHREAAGVPPPAHQRGVFTRPRSVMRSMIASIEAQAASMAAGRLAPGDEWTRSRFLDTRERPALSRRENTRGYSCWRLMVKIPESRTYKSLGEIGDPAERLRVAGEAGPGARHLRRLTCTMRTDDLENPLPGYRDPPVLTTVRSSSPAAGRPRRPAPSSPSDPTVRHSTEEHFLVHPTSPSTAGEPTTPIPSVGRPRAVRGGLRRQRLEGMESGRIRRARDPRRHTSWTTFLFSRARGASRRSWTSTRSCPHLASPTGGHG